MSIDATQSYLEALSEASKILGKAQAAMSRVGDAKSEARLLQIRVTLGRLVEEIEGAEHVTMVRPAVSWSEVPCGSLCKTLGGQIVVKDCYHHGCFAWQPLPDSQEAQGQRLAPDSSVLTNGKFFLLSRFRYHETRS